MATASLKSLQEEDSIPLKFMCPPYLPARIKPIILFRVYLELMINEEVVVYSCLISEFPF